ncbi:MAG TPA: Maf family protein [Candidatus Acidoferrales bacterium]|nr:Maf family protein [Candidatus Acidoferrales bacterium]
MLLSSIKDKLLAPQHRTKLILASKSPRRVDILRKAGFAFEVRATDIDESPRGRESARTHVLRLAREKARAVAEQLGENSRAVVIGADTVVVIGGKILGKPSDVREARAMLRLLNGKTHQVLTGVSIVSMHDKRELNRVESTRVHFLKLSKKEIEDYIHTGEPFDKAGGYGIQGIAGRFIDRVDGCYFNVMGLPISLVWTMLRRLGVANR